MLKLALALSALVGAAASMPRLNLTTGGPEVSRVGLGTLHVGQPHFKDPNDVLDWLNAALDLGITLLDTADVYPVVGGSQGDAATIVGQAFALQPGLRDKFTITSKVDISSILHEQTDVDIDYLQEKVEWYLEALQTDHLDIFLLHYPSPLLDIDAVASWVHSRISDGTFRHFGVSNFQTWNFEALQSRLDDYGIKIVTNEIELSVWNPSAANYDSSALDMLFKNRVHPLAWSALGGQPVGGVNRLFVRKGTREYKIRKQLRQVADDIGGDLAEDVIALAWLLKLPVGVVPLIGSTKIDRLKHQVTAVDVTLSSSQWWDIAAAGGVCAQGQAECDYDLYTPNVVGKA